MKKVPGPGVGRLLVPPRVEVSSNENDDIRWRFARTSHPTMGRAQILR